jgi:HEAT repeat protein
MSDDDDDVQRLHSADVDVQMAAVLDLVDQGRRDALAELIELADSPDVALRSTVAAALGVLGAHDPDPAGRRLLALARDDDSLVRSEAIDALGNLRYAPAADVISDALADPESAVRAAAAETAGELGGRELVPALERALDDPDAPVRAYAASSLGQLGGEELLDRLRERVDTEQSPHVRAELLAACHRLGGDGCLTGLAELLDQTGEDDVDALLNTVDALAEQPPATPLTDDETIGAALKRLAVRLPQRRAHIAQILARLAA